MALSIVSCSSKDKDAKKPADYGNYGADFARKLSVQYPGRKAYSSDEAYAGDMIAEELEKYGFEVKKQKFSNANGQSSQNYVVHIEGKGFIEVDEDGNKIGEIRRKAVIGAHYDSFLGLEEIPDDRSYDAISDNSSGVGCIITIARHIMDYKDIGFDVDLVLFGASTDN